MSTTVPDAPVMLYAVAGNAQATVYWAAPTVSASITSYTLTVSSSIPTNGSITTFNTPSPITVNATQYTVTGLTNGVSYRFTVTATNSVGTSAPSNASNSVTPPATNALCHVQFRRGPSAVWSTVNPVLAQGELAIDLDAQKFKIGDATTSWNALSYGGTTGATGPAVMNVTNAATNRLITTDTTGKYVSAQSALRFTGGTTLEMSTISTTTLLLSTVSTNTLSATQANARYIYTNTVTSANAIAITAPSASLTGNLVAQNEFYSMYYDVASNYNAVSASSLSLCVSAPTYLLELRNDGAFKPGTTVWTTGSDARIKTNIVSADLDRCYSTIQAIQLRYFGWNPEIYSPNIVHDRHVVGFIAQDVKVLFPKSVDIVDECTIGNTSFTQFHTLNADQIYTTNIGAVKRLIQIVDAQQSTLDGFAAAYDAQQSTMRGGYRLPSP